MKRLTLLRHAKSSWDHPDLQDIERPLNSRGRRDAPLMGTVCAESLPPPDLIVMSPAQRTRDTIDAFIEAWGLDAVKIVTDDRLYLAGVSDWLAVLREHGSPFGHVLGCAHQPGIGDFARWLKPGFSGDVPTAAVISFTVDESLDQGCGDVVFHGIPRDYRD